MDTNRSNAEENPHNISLPDGSNVDIETEEGANLSPNGVSTFDQHFSSKLMEYMALRKKKRRNARDEKKMDEVYNFLITQVTNCTKMPKSEIREFLNFNIEEIKSFTKKQIWIKTGLLERSDYYVLNFCDDMFCHLPAVADTALESEFFQVLADFIKARKGNGTGLPKAAISASIGRIVCCPLGEPGLDSSWSMDKIFKKFEECGILEQILRCSTVEESKYGSNDSFDFILKNLQTCTWILTRKFKSGKPCGDTLKAILDGRDGSTSIEPKILNRLQGIATLVETMDTKEFKANLDSDKCMYCFENGTTEAPLLCCSRCRLACYCSKECQKAHWKMHKLSCEKLSKPERERRLSFTMVTRRFFNQHFETVFQALQEKCDSTGVELCDLAVEIDFMPNGTGIIPALQDPPVFKIALIQDYMSGQDMPEWRKVTDLEVTEFKDLVKQLKTGVKFASALLVVHHGGYLSMFPNAIQIPQFCKADV